MERYGSVRAAPVKNSRFAALSPVVNRFVDRNSHLMTDQFSTYKTIGLQFASHQSVNHGIYEYARGEVHNNTAESFSAIVERAKQGVFHYWSKDHMQRYLHEVEFRWNHRVPKLKKTKKGTIKIVMVQMPFMKMLKSLLSSAFGKQVRRSANGGIICLNSAC